MPKTREERKRERSLKASRAAQIGWDRRHAEMSAAGVVIQYDQHHAYGEYEIIVRSLRSGRSHTIHLREGSRRDNFFADMDGKPWKPVSPSSIAAIIRKSIVKTRSGRII